MAQGQACWVGFKESYRGMDGASTIGQMGGFGIGKNNNGTGGFN